MLVVHVGLKRRLGAKILLTYFTPLEEGLFPCMAPLMLLQFKLAVHAFAAKLTVMFEFFVVDCINVICQGSLGLEKFATRRAGMGWVTVNSFHVFIKAELTPAQFPTFNAGNFHVTMQAVHVGL